MPKSSDTTGDGSSEEQGPGYRWLGTTAAADLLGVVPRTLYRLIDEGLLPAYKMGRVIRLKSTDLDAYLEQQRVQPGDLKHLYPERTDEP